MWGKLLMNGCMAIRTGRHVVHVETGMQFWILDWCDPTVQKEFEQETFTRSRSVGRLHLFGPAGLCTEKLPLPLPTGNWEKIIFVAFVLLMARECSSILIST